jgi:hypothetical protein
MYQRLKVSKPGSRTILAVTTSDVANAIDLLVKAPETEGEVALTEEEVVTYGIKTDEQFGFINGFLRPEPAVSTLEYMSWCFD